MPSKHLKKQIVGKSQKGQEIPALWTEEQARDYFEKRRWHGTPACPHCGSVNVYRLQGETCRPGLWECREPECRKQFTVTVGTVMEDSHLPLKVWAMAFHFMTTSKKGMSALQLQRNLGLGSYRTAWFLSHRIREAMRCEPVASKLKGEVQIDEAYIGANRRSKRGDGFRRKRGRGTTKIPVLALVETGGSAKSMPIEKVTVANLNAAMREHVDLSARIVTDEYNAYQKPASQFAGGHYTVCHSQNEYVSGSGRTTNEVEAFFALLKRGIHGTFHHVSKKHLGRYCDEFSFRWNGRKLEDVQRRDAAVVGAEGKRLMYKGPIKPKVEPKQDGDQLSI
jgi:transposase-like protein